MSIRTPAPAFAQTALRQRHQIATKPASLIFLATTLPYVTTLLKGCSANSIDGPFSLHQRAQKAFKLGLKAFNDIGVRRRSARLCNRLGYPNWISRESSVERISEGLAE